MVELVCKRIGNISMSNVFKIRLEWVTDRHVTGKIHRQMLCYTGTFTRVCRLLMLLYLCCWYNFRPDKNILRRHWKFVLLELSLLLVFSHPIHFKVHWNMYLIINRYDTEWNLIYSAASLQFIVNLSPLIVSSIRLGSAIIITSLFIHWTIRTCNPDSEILVLSK